jgi:hypothetical protein
LEREERYASLIAALEGAHADVVGTRHELARWQCAHGNVAALSSVSGELFVTLLAALESNSEVVVVLRARLVEALQEDLALRRPRAPALAIVEALDPDFVPPLELNEWRKWYDHLVFQVTREDELVHQRLTWLMQFQGFLFTAFGFILASRSDFTPKPLLLVLLGMISSVGLAGAFAVQRGVRSAHLVLDSLKRAYLASFERFKTSHVRPFGKHSEHRQLVSSMLPWTMMIAWVSIQLALLWRLLVYHWR